MRVPCLRTQVWSAAKAVEAANISNTSGNVLFINPVGRSVIADEFSPASEIAGSLPGWKPSAAAPRCPDSGDASVEASIGIPSHSRAASCACSVVQDSQVLKVSTNHGSRELFLKLHGN